MSAFNPSRILAILNEHQVRYVVIGGVAAAIHGSNTDTYDLDICYSRTRENLVKLAAALREMDARLRGFPSDLPFVLDDQTLRNGDTFTFATSFGDFDCLAVPQATTGYDALYANSSLADFGNDMTIRISSIDDLILMKRAAGRPKDMATINALEAIKQLLADPE